MYDELRRAWAELTAPGAPFEVTRVPVRGQDLLAYVHAHPTLRHLWLDSARHGDAPYLVYEPPSGLDPDAGGPTRLSYAETHRRVSGFASWLWTRGVRPGDRVAIAMRNHAEWIQAYWACVSIGVTAVGMNAWWSPAELAYGIENSEPSVLVVDAERLMRLRACGAPLEDRSVVTVRTEGGPETVRWEDAVDTPGVLPDVDVDPDADACIFYTSGTTGFPKGAQLTHRGCTTNVTTIAFWAAVQQRASEQLDPAGSPTRTPSAPSPMVALMSTPLFHVMANNCVAQPVTANGGVLVHLHHWDPAEALRLIEQERVTRFSGVPVQSRELVTHPDFARRDTSSLQAIGGGGAPLPPDLVHRIDTATPSVRPTTGYGLTETSGTITATSADFFVDRPGSCGPILPSFEARIVGPDGRPATGGDAGELLVRGAQVVKGYLDRPDETAEAIVDGWFHTGDIAVIDDDGFVTIVDRAKDMVLRGGENVSCAEVEAALYTFPGVAECAVFGVADERLGEEVGAAIVPTSDTAGCTPDALRAHVRELLAAHKVPRHVWILDEPLPRNATGKFVKRTLRDLLDPADAR